MVGQVGGWPGAIMQQWELLGARAQFSSILDRCSGARGGRRAQGEADFESNS